MGALSGPPGHTPAAVSTPRGATGRPHAVFSNTDMSMKRPVGGEVVEGECEGEG